MATIATPIDTREISAQVLLAKGTDPANAVLVGLEDRIYLLYWSSIPAANLTITLRVLNPNGSISLNSYTIVTNGLRSSTATILPTGEGLLLGAVLNTFSSVNVRRGQLYAQLMVNRGGLINTTQFTQYLCGGYVTSETPIFYPFSPYDPSMGGRGNFRSITGTTPAPGIEIRETVPYGAVWKVNAIRFALTCSGDVSTRGVSILFIDDMSQGTGQVVSLTPLEAGAALVFSFVAGADNAYLNSTFSVQCPLPTDMLLPPGFAFSTSTAGLMPGDQFSSIQYVVEEWLQV